MKQRLSHGDVEGCPSAWDAGSCSAQLGTVNSKVLCLVWCASLWWSASARLLPSFAISQQAQALPSLLWCRAYAAQSIIIRPVGKPAPPVPSHIVDTGMIVTA
jgi:hypothetical protein